jgi:hypothetical protein
VPRAKPNGTGNVFGSLGESYGQRSLTRDGVGVAIVSEKVRLSVKNVIGAQKQFEFMHQLFSFGRYGGGTRERRIERKHGAIIPLRNIRTVRTRLEGMGYNLQQ